LTILIAKFGQVSTQVPHPLQNGSTIILLVLILMDSGALLPKFANQ